MIQKEKESTFKRKHTVKGILAEKKKGEKREKGEGAHFMKLSLTLAVKEEASFVSNNPRPKSNG